MGVVPSFKFLNTCRRKKLCVVFKPVPINSAVRNFFFFRVVLAHADLECKSPKPQNPKTPTNEKNRISKIIKIMTWRLLEHDSKHRSLVISHKIFWGISVLTLIPIIYLFIYSFKVRSQSIRIKLWAIYSILMVECMFIILHYGFVPSQSSLNSYFALFQQFVQFIFY